MTAEEFRAAIAEFKQDREWCQTVVQITFTDGAWHLTALWTVETH